MAASRRRLTLLLRKYNKAHIVPMHAGILRHQTVAVLSFGSRTPNRPLTDDVSWRVLMQALKPVWSECAGTASVLDVSGFPDCSPSTVVGP